MTGGAAPERRVDLLARLALLSLPAIGPYRLRWLLGDGEAPAAVDRLRRRRIEPAAGPAPTGVTADLVTRWAETIRSIDAEAELARHRELGIRIAHPSDPAWPFGDEPDPPLLVFHFGDLEVVRERPAVAVVGTRRCTTVGRTVAFELGRDLAGSGVGVVSGLALGIDGSAHRGAIHGGGRPIGVVGSGLDVVYPGAHRWLWAEVARLGVLISESPAGTRPRRWRFPARNRLMASVSRAVVVVESHARGGSLLTADEAAERGRPVLAVPGAITSPASEGTNGLLVDGATPIRSATDILEALSIAPADPPRARPSEEADAEPPPGGPPPTGPPPVDPPARPTAAADPSPASPANPSSTPPDSAWPALDERILAEVATGPVHVDRLALAAGASIPAVLDAVQRLAAAGHLQLHGSTAALRPPDDQPPEATCTHQ